MRIFLGSILALALLGSCSTPRIAKNSSPEGKIAGDKGLSKTFEDLIPKGSIGQEGLFTVHQVGNRYFFEIPDSLLGREILVVTRFVRTPAGSGSYGGEEIGKKTILWERGPQNNLFLRIGTLVGMANENDAISQAVNNANITPILAAFDIKSRNGKNRSSLIDVTDFINSENTLLALSDAQKESYQLSFLEKDKSYIKKISSFPINTEVLSVKTYKARTSTKDKKEIPAAVLSGMVTVEINNSFILLPTDPMPKRFYDPRVGYFASSYLEYGDDQQKVDRNIFIHRWRIEPRPEDLQKWQNGELVEPKKPIVFYIDPATPKKWRPYLIQGVNDWQKAFVQAGFKNAIMGKEWPEDDKSMSLEDARFSVIRYFASPNKNAYGPNITDPRSGEILESHIGWYHNLMDLLRNWYTIQAGAVDPGAQKMEYDTELMGELIRFVSSHEVGHTLGLRHNMGASHATPVEKLRDAKWLEKNGHTSSIMDYARFNYVAQPQDSIPPKNLMPKIGDYDKWAIQWGYSKLPIAESLVDEREVLNQWVMDSIASNPRLWFGGDGKDFDPRSQSEDLGDNAMMASTYGIMNLQRILPQLTTWTKERNSDDYSNLDELYRGLIKQYENYLFHVTKNIGGIYVTPKTMGDPGEIYSPVPKKTQKEALAFLNNHIIKEPKWLLNKDILNKISSPQSKEAIIKSMENVVMNLVGGSRLGRMTYIAERYGEEGEVYAPDEYLDDLNQIIWGEMNVFYSTNAYQRKLQKAFVANLISLYKPNKAEGLVEGILAKLSEGYTVNTDVRSLALDNLNRLQTKIKGTLPVITHRMTKAHLLYLQREIEEVIGGSESPGNHFIPANPDLSLEKNP